MKILVVRDDRLGDFMVTWPAISQLHQSWPDAEIHLLVAAANVEIAQLCPGVAGVIGDPGGNASPDAESELRATLRAHRFDASITMFSTGRIGWHLFRARIPYRLVPASKAASLLHTRRLVQRRSQSRKPEFAYNQDLVVRFLQDHSREVAPPKGPPYLVFDPASLQPVREALRNEWGSGERALVVVHPGTGGTAPRIDLERYAILCKSLRSPRGVHIVISAGPGEAELAKGLSSRLSDVPHSVHLSTDGLVAYARVLACCDAFISGSTGPLHLAGALNLKTAGLYLPIGTASALRWQPINDPLRHLAISPPPDAAPADPAGIDISAAAAAISERLLRDA